MLFKFVFTLFRSKHRRWSIKKAVLKNFVIFTWKHLCWSLFFNEAAGLYFCNFIRKRLQHRCSTVIIAKVLRIPILKNICKRLLLFIQTICWYTWIVSEKNMLPERFWVYKEKCHLQRKISFVKKNLELLKK